MNDIKLPTLDESDDAEPLPEHGYLANAMFDTDEYMPEYDAPSSYVGDFTYRQLYEYGGCIYTYTATGDHDGFITVTDKATHTSVPLCTVDGCPHTGTGCESYINGAVYGFRVYDGALMWVQGLFDTSSTASLVKCGLDGGMRETVWSCGMTNNELGFNFADFFARIYGSFEVAIHRGYIYFSGVSQTAALPQYSPNTR